MDWWKLKTPGPDLFREETQKSAFEQALKGDFTQEQDQATRSRHIARHLPLHGLGFWGTTHVPATCSKDKHFRLVRIDEVRIFMYFPSSYKFQTVSNCSTLGPWDSTALFGHGLFFPAEPTAGRS